MYVFAFIASRHVNVDVPDLALAWHHQDRSDAQYVEVSALMFGVHHYSAGISSSRSNIGFP